MRYTAAPAERWQRVDYDDQAARELLDLLVHAHSVLDRRDHEQGTYLPPRLRRRHIPRHHPAWWQTEPAPDPQIREIA